jgi:hypothetical protein
MLISRGVVGVVFASMEFCDLSLGGDEGDQAMDCSR